MIKIEKYIEKIKKNKTFLKIKLLKIQLEVKRIIKFPLMWN